MSLVGIENKKQPLFVYTTYICIYELLNIPTTLYTFFFPLKQRPRATVARIIAVVSEQCVKYKYNKTIYIFLNTI